MQDGAEAVGMLEMMIGVHKIEKSSFEQIAIGAGMAFARESANVVLIGNNVAKFVETPHVARNCRRIIRESFYGGKCREVG